MFNVNVIVLLTWIVARRGYGRNDSSPEEMGVVENWCKQLQTLDWCKYFVDVFEATVKPLFWEKGAELRILKPLDVKFKQFHPLPFELPRTVSGF